MNADEDFAAYAAARWGNLVRSAVFLGCSIDEAHDLAQVTLLRCYQRWRRVQRADNRDAYVYRMLVNVRNDSRRRRWWGERPTANLLEQVSVYDQVDQVDQVADADAIHRALAELAKGAREVVVLRYFAQLTDQETADALNIPIGTVKSRLSRALTQLASNAHLSDLTEGTS